MTWTENAQVQIIPWSWRRNVGTGPCDIGSGYGTGEIEQTTSSTRNVPARSAPGTRTDFS